MYQTLKSAPQKTDHRPINGDNCFEENTDDEHRIPPPPRLVCLGECLEYLSLLGQFFFCTQSCFSKLCLFVELMPKEILMSIHLILFQHRKCEY